MFSRCTLITSSMDVKVSSILCFFFVSTYTHRTSDLIVSLNASTLSIFIFDNSTRVCSMKCSAVLTSPRIFLLSMYVMFSFLKVL